MISKKNLLLLVLFLFLVYLMCKLKENFQTKSEPKQIVYDLNKLDKIKTNFGNEICLKKGTKTVCLNYEDFKHIKTKYNL
jgi:hypothetical protein